MKAFIPVFNVPACLKSILYRRRLRGWKWSDNKKQHQIKGFTVFIITGILQTTPAKPCVSLWCWLIGTGEEKHANAKELETLSKLFLSRHGSKGAKVRTIKNYKWQYILSMLSQNNKEDG